jgi:N-acetyl-anhydromuramoyl-L-alanine amidase
MSESLRWVDGWLAGARRVDSPNFDERSAGATIDVVVLHHISLPANQFAGDAVERLFLNQLGDSDDPELRALATLTVSAHFFIRRDGELVQFVSAESRAWHAGVSAWRGRSACNDFSIGIELEGNAVAPFTDAQYAALNALLSAIAAGHPGIAVTTHSEIAAGRKLDPGPTFDWSKLDRCYQM